MPGAMNAHPDPLVDHYLHRLEAAASPLPARQRGGPDAAFSQVNGLAVEAPGSFAKNQGHGARS
jgi:hypothetical protein